MSGETTEMSKYQLDACVVDDQPAVLAHQADDFLIVDIEGYVDGELKIRMYSPRKPQVMHIKQEYRWAV